MSEMVMSLKVQKFSWFSRAQIISVLNVYEDKFEFKTSDKQVDYVFEEVVLLKSINLLLNRVYQLKTKSGKKLQFIIAAPSTKKRGEFYKVFESIKAKLNV